MNACYELRIRTEVRHRHQRKAEAIEHHISVSSLLLVFRLLTRSLNKVELPP